MLSIALAFALQIPVHPRPIPLCAVPSYGEHTIQVAGNSETYQVWGPPGFTGPAPLLVLFHSLYGSHEELSKPIWNGYDLKDEAVGRGWYVVVHDGGLGTCTVVPNYATYGDDTFQRHTEAVIKDVVCRFPINLDRIYGYGFSMGGEEVLAFAARHRNPASKIFLSAVVNHSGYLSPIYQELGELHTSPSCGEFPDCIYDADPYCTEPFKWRKACVLDLEEVCPTYLGAWPPTKFDVNFYYSQIHNLARTPLRTYYEASEDPCMIEMNDLLADWLSHYYQVANLIQLNCTLPTCGSNPPDCQPAHTWAAVCADDALDWMEQHTRDSVMTAVNSGQGIILCAEDNVRYYHFKVVRSLPTDFGRIHWFKPTTSGSIGFLAPNPGLGSGTHNLAELTIFPGLPWMPFLDPAQDLAIHTKWSMTVHVTGYPNPPSWVELVGSGSQPFQHDPASGTVTFVTGTPPPQGTEVWIIHP